MNTFSIALFVIQWMNIISILVALVFVLLTSRKYRGVIGNALTYLSIGIIIFALISVTDLLQIAINTNNMQNLNYLDVLHSLVFTISFLMISAGFYKLSKIYKRV